VTLAGSLTLNVEDSSVVVDEIPGVAHVAATSCSPARLHAGSLLKVFVATSNGVVDVAPVACPDQRQPDGLIWNGTLPWPWPVSAPTTCWSATAMRRCSWFARTQGSPSPTPGRGAARQRELDPQVPSITGINGVQLSATSSDESIATANVEGLVIPNAEATIQGSGFVNRW